MMHSMFQGYAGTGTLKGQSAARLVVGLALLLGLLLPALTFADVGHNSCVGRSACDGNSGTVGNDACNGFQACINNHGTIGNNSCNAENACRNNTRTIGNDQCNTPGECAQ
jgi:hypothetical protein